MELQTRIFFEPTAAPVSIQSWPASGGGLLVCMNLPVFRCQDGPLRRSLPNFFLSVDLDGLVRVSVPYVFLDRSALAHIAYLVAGELDLPLHQIQVAGRPERFPGAAETDGSTLGDFDVDRGAGHSLRITAAAVRAMLIEAAAENWNVRSDECRILDGQVYHTPTQRHFRFGSIAGDAALQQMPRR